MIKDGKFSGVIAAIGKSIEKDGKKGRGIKLENESNWLNFWTEADLPVFEVGSSISGTYKDNKGYFVVTNVDNYEETKNENKVFEQADQLHSTDIDISAKVLLMGKIDEELRKVNYFGFPPEQASRILISLFIQQTNKR